MVKRILCIGVASIALCDAASALPFEPVFDEFWIVRNGSEIFRDSFDDGVLPPSGPDGAVTYSDDPQAGLGGMASEAGGKLTMTPALGVPTLITGGFADTFTGGLRLASTNPASGNFLGLDESFEIHGLFDLSSLPGITGQAFGIRATDRAGAGTGDDVGQLTVWKSQTTGDIGIRFAELDFIGDTNETAGFVSIASVLIDALQVELVISKAAGANTVDASYTVYGAGASVLQSGGVDGINDVTGDPITLYNGELFTRAQFVALDTGVPVPEPATLGLFGVGLAGLAAASRRRRKAA
jgi:hypothetical protein